MEALKSRVALQQKIISVLTPANSCQGEAIISSRELRDIKASRAHVIDRCSCYRKAMLRRILRIPGAIAKTALRAWQKTRILRRPSCRFYPSCSEYMFGCIEQHGVIKGLVAGAVRLLRCNPWNLGGIDTVPECLPFRRIFQLKKRTR